MIRRRTALGALTLAGSAVLLAPATVAGAALGWSKPVPISSNGSLATVSCASPRFCIALASGGTVIKWDGATWSAPVQVFATSSNPDAVSCPSAQFCAAVDAQGHAATWNGHTWSAPEDINGTSQLFGVSCLSRSFCVAVGGNGDAFTWRGSTWSAPVNADAANPLTSVSCVSTSFCTAVDPGDAVTWNGSSWSSPIKIDPGNLGWVSCASASFCVAVDDFGNATTMWNGHSWSPEVDIDPPSGTFTNRLSGVSCTSSTFCVAVAVLGQGIVWNGSKWGAPTSFVASGQDLDSFYDPVSCVSASFCMVVGTYPSPFAVTYGTFSPLRPVLGKSVEASLVSGSVSVESPGSTSFAPLSAATPIAVGSTVNATAGRVRLTLAQPSHGTGSGVFYGGEFELGQARSGVGDLRLTGGVACAGAGRASRSHKPSWQRLLWGNSKAPVTTIGQDASATVLDPNWLVQDTCSGTLVRVASGKVRVDDFVTHRRFVLRAPHSYLAHG